MPVIIWGLVWQKHVSRAGTSNYIPQILWDVITCPCPWYLFLTHCHHMSQTGMQGINNYIPQNAVSICSISHNICTWFYHALFRVIILSAHCDSLRWNYPYPSRLLHWYWGNRNCPSTRAATPSTWVNMKDASLKFGNGWMISPNTL